MMQPRPPAAARVPEPSGRKRKRPQSSKRVDAAASPESETEDEGHAAGRTTKPKLVDAEETKKEEPQSESRGAEATVKDDASGLSRPFRGKCLYQSRKCENERALKRNGKAHNLCEEHRSKQNQHQRKFDAKKYSRRKRKRSTSGDEDDQHDGDDEPEHGDAMPPRAKRPAVGPSAPEELLQRMMPPAQPVLPHDTRPLAARRPYPLQTARSPPANAFPLPGQHPRSPPVTILGRSPQAGPPGYSQSEILAATILVPPRGPAERTRSYASPHAHSHASTLPMAPQPRSRSFDMGVTRISPVGGAAYTAAGPPFAFDQQRLLSHDPRTQVRVTQSFAPSGRIESKLPSLQQLPLAGLTRRSPPPAAASPQLFHHVERPLSPQSYQQHSPHNGAPYYEQLPPPEPRGVAYARPPPPQPGRVLPSLAAIARPTQPRQASPPSVQPSQSSLTPRQLSPHPPY